MPHKPGDPHTTVHMMGGDAGPHSRLVTETEEVVAVVALMRARALPPIHLSAALEYLGSAAALVESALEGPVQLDSGTEVKRLDHGVLERAAEEVAKWNERGLVVSNPLVASYPRNLRSVFDHPPLLFIEGSVEAAGHREAIAIVGTREVSDEGRKRAFRLAHAVAKAGFVVVSGLAKGVDICAHMGALKAGGRTVAVMGTGHDHVYPAVHRQYSRDIIEQGGALVSQFFPEQRGAQWSFPVRNVTMSGMSLATVVIEAGATSGAKMQAEAALRHGRPVFLPKSLVDAYEWAYKMVHEGVAGARAIQIDSSDDLISAFREVPAEPATALL